ncbi:hypothetical protein RMCBS344292_14929 [Rhizopus microsporus]|nr:hypothetical protein RMCBS344292_14929 [Rhizopus microsporus]
MPEKVPLYVLCSQLIQRLMYLLKTLFRSIIVIFVWLVILPNFTLWTWRFYFWSGEHIGFNTIKTSNMTITSEDKVTSSVLKSFLSDCFEGQIITAFVVIIFVAAYLFREWVMQNLPADRNNNNFEPVVVQEQQQQNRDEQQLVQEQVAIDTLLNVVQVMNPPTPERRHDPENEYIQHLEHQLGGIRNEIENELNHRHHRHSTESAVHWLNHPEEEEEGENDRLNALFAGSSSRPSFMLDSDQHEPQEEGAPETGHDEFLPPFYQHRPEVLAGRDLHLDELDVRRDEEFHYRRHFQQMDNAIFERPRAPHNPIVPPPLPPPPPPAEDNEEPFEVADDINGVLEAIGMRGNPWMLVQNSVLMSLMISLCLGLAVWIPYVVGRLVIMIRPISFIETPIYILRFITDPLVDFVLDTCLPYAWSVIEVYWKQFVPEPIQVTVSSVYDELSKESPVLHAANGTSSQGLFDLTFIHTQLEETSKRALERWYQFALGQTVLDRSMCILVGYFVFICLGSWYLAHGRRRGSSRTAVQDVIRQQGIFLKVLFFIVIELVVFPTVCGFLLDLATLPLFVNASIESRYMFHLKSPYSSYFLHWFLGTGVLFYFAIFITVCREIIRPGVMWFIRDPNDPQFHPVQEMVERPLPNLLHKISQSALIYSVMLVFGVGTVTYSLAYTGVVFPLRLPFNKPLSTLAVDLLITQFLVPPLVQFMNPRENSKRALDLWWHFASRQLRLTSFMFNVRMPDEEGRHVRKTLKAWILREKATIPTDEFSDVGIDSDDNVVFKRDGMLMRVPKYDSVPVDPKRRMLVPVDPVTLEAIDEEERRRGHPAAADTGDESQSTIVVYVPPHFKLRTIIFLLFMWFSISLFVCSVTVVPLLVGRLLFKVYLAPQADVVNDLYSFALGLYLMMCIGYLAHWLYQSYVAYSARGNAQTEQCLAYIKEKGIKASRYIYLISTLAVIIPLLLGVSVDLFVFMPIRIHNSSGPIVINLSQDWAFGIVCMSIIYHTVLLLPTTNAVRQYMDQIFGNNMIQADLNLITRKVIAPVIITTLLAIITPGVISFCILYIMGTSRDPSYQLLVTRYTYPSIFCLMITTLLCLIFKKLFSIWIQTVRDDTYLIGKKLHNLEE